MRSTPTPRVPPARRGPAAGSPWSSPTTSSAARTRRAVLAELERTNLFVARLEHGGWYRVHSLFAEFAALPARRRGAGARSRTSTGAPRLGSSARGLPRRGRRARRRRGRPRVRRRAARRRTTSRSCGRGRARTLLRWVQDAAGRRGRSRIRSSRSARRPRRRWSVDAVERRRLLHLADRARDEQPERVGPYVEAVASMVRASAVDARRRRGGDRRPARGGDVARTRAADAGPRRRARRPRPRALPRRRPRRRVGRGAARGRAPRRGPPGARPRVRPLDARARRGRARPAGGGARPRRQGEGARQRRRQQPELARGERVRRARRRARRRGPASPRPSASSSGAERFFRDEVATVHHAWLLVVLADVRCRRGRLDDAADAAALRARGDGRSRRLRARPGARRRRRREARGARRAAPRAARCSTRRARPSSRSSGSWRRDLSTREIGGELFLSPNTVRTHTRALYRKLAVNSRADAVARADVLGLLAQAKSPR